MCSVIVILDEAVLNDVAKKWTGSTVYVVTAYIWDAASFASQNL